MEDGKVPTWAQSFITQEQAHEIAKVIFEVEAKSSTEIVPIIARSVSLTGHLPKIVFSVLLLIIALGIMGWVQFVGWVTLQKVTVVAVAALMLISWISIKYSRSPFFVRLFSSSRDLEQRVWEQAELEFYRHKVHQTKEKTGALIFVAILEKKAVLLVDPEAKAQLPENLIQSFIDDIVGGASRGELPIGITRAIQRITPTFVRLWPRAQGDINELGNHVRFLD